MLLTVDNFLLFPFTYFYFYVIIKIEISNIF